MSLDTAAPQLAERSWAGAVSLALRLVLVLALLAIVVQAAIVVRARPQDLITGAYGMADIIRRAMPPDFSKIDMVWWPALETIDLGIFGTVGGVILALPLAVLAAANVTPSRFLYYAARGVIGFARAVPDLVWALLFVTAVGLGPFPGALALSVHSIGMLGRLFAETIEHMDMAPIDALTLTGARRVQVFTHGDHPVDPALAARDRALSARREHPLVAGARLCRRRRHRLRAAVGDEPVSIPARFAAADRHLCHRDCRRAPFRAAPRAPRLTGSKSCNCHFRIVLSVSAPVSGRGLRLKELPMPDLDQIKQVEQECDSRLSMERAIMHFDPAEIAYVPTTGVRRVHETPLVAASDDTLQGYGCLVDAPESFPIEIVRWPAQGWRPIDENSGDQGGVAEGVFEFWWKGETLYARNNAVGDSYLFAWSNWPEEAATDGPGKTAATGADLARELPPRWRPAVLSVAWREFRRAARPAGGRCDTGAVRHVLV